MPPILPANPIARRHVAIAAATLLWLAGCNTPPSPVTPPSSPAPTGSAAVETRASESPDAGPLRFRDDFDGNDLDAARWTVFKQSGVVSVRDGQVEILNSNGKTDYPYVLAKSHVMPPTGPFYLEVAYDFITSGSFSFCLDYLPAEDPADRPLSKPFMYSYQTRQGLRFRFMTETHDVVLTGKPGTEQKRHVLRLESDGVNQFRLIIDGAEVGKFESRRRPTRFWMGHSSALPASNIWSRAKVDYVEAGTLLTPASAIPLPTPTPSPSGSPNPSASPAG